VTKNATTVPDTVEFMSMVKELIAKEKGNADAVTDYQLAKYFGWSTSRISNYMGRVRTLDDEACEAVSDALKIPLETVLACIYLERSRRSENDKLTQAWEHICQSVAPSLAPAVIGLALGFETARVILSL
jgi:transcriptional regulator with XRE-family HTH domain